METLRRRSRKLIWLNPLLGSPGYEPLTQGCRRRFPCQRLRPGAYLVALRALERHLLA